MAKAQTEPAAEFSLPSWDQVLAAVGADRAKIAEHLKELAARYPALEDYEHFAEQYLQEVLSNQVIGNVITQILADSRVLLETGSGPTRRNRVALA